MNVMPCNVQVEALEKQIDSNLHVIYLKQLSLIREKTLKNFKKNLIPTENEDEEVVEVVAAMKVRSLLK